MNTSLHSRIANYIYKITDDTFRIINKENDARIVVAIIGNKKKDVACLVLMKSKAHLKLYNRVSYRLANNFKRNFGLDIHFFPAMEGYAESLYTVNLIKNGDYGVHINPPKEHGPIIDPNHTVLYMITNNLGEFTISMFPHSKTGLFANVLYPGYDIMKGRILSKEIMELKGGHHTYAGRKGWKEYCEDYATLCNGIKPDHDITCKIIYDGHILV